MTEVWKSQYRMNMKRIISLVLAGVIIILPISPAFAADSTASQSATSAPTQDVAAPPANTNDKTSPAPAGKDASKSAADSKPVTEVPADSKTDPSAAKSDSTSSKNKSNIASPNSAATSATTPTVPGSTQPYNTSGGQKVLQPKTDLSSGALTFEYPIQSPPGRNGQTPDIKLQYNSKSSNNDSIFGYGWTSNIPYIERINKDGTNNLYGENYFYSSLDGELVPLGSGNFGPKVESGSFSSYNFTTNNWLVTDKQGTKYKFGFSTASRLDNPNDANKIFRWMLEEVRDTNGNFITYTYYKNSGQIYPAAITYSNNGTTAGIFEVDFLRQSRGDVFKSGGTGFAVTTNYLINEIDIKVSGTWTKKYLLSYNTGANGNRSLLANIVESGQDGSSGVTTLPATVFSYTQSTTGFTLTNKVTSYIPIATQSGVIPADVNGDGYSDLLQAWQNTYVNYYSYKGVYLYHPESDNFQLDGTRQIPENIFITTQDYNGQHDSGTKAVDANGDGLNDLLRADDSNGGAVVGYINNNASGWTSNPSFAPAMNPYALTDLNGDGLPDYIKDVNTGFDYPTGTSLYATNAALDTGSTFNYYPADVGGIFRTPEFLRDHIFADVNGDGLPDIVKSTYLCGTGMSQSIYINTGTGWVLDSSYTLPSDFEIYNTCGGTGGQFRRSYFQDINQDGLVDILLPLSVTGACGVDCTNLKVYINKGHSWVYDYHWNPGGELGSNPNDNTPTPGMLFDANGDGSADIINTSTTSGVTSSTVYYNNNHGPVDSLSSITLPTGGQTSVGYKMSEQYKDASGNLLSPKLPQNISTVSQITVNDGNGNSGTTSYSYQNGSYFFNGSSDRKFAGFNKVTETDPAGNTTSTFYHQGNTSDSIHGEFNDDEWKIGKPYRVEVANSSGALYSKSINKWDEFDLGNGSKFVKLAQTTDYTYDGDTSHNDQAEAYTYNNANGNISQKKEFGIVTGSDDGTFADSGADDFTTTYTYTANILANIIGLPDYKNVTDHAGNKVKESRYYYDNLVLGQVSKGNQTKEEDWKSGTQVGSITPPAPPSSAPVKALVVAGGGGGGSVASNGNLANSGGGGAGGLIFSVSSTVAIGSYPVTVGSGGIGGYGNSVQGTNGGNSIFNSLTAIGGGGGGYGGTGPGFMGSDGGSGGGAGGKGPDSAGVVWTGGTGTNGQGYNGGNVPAFNNNAAGGGGAGFVGGTASNNNGVGGLGISNYISGSLVTYASGGGGGATGAGVGGNTSTGSGGGGVQALTNGAGGNGGSGVVIISYPTGSVSATGGAITNSGGNTIHTFTSGGTFTVTSVSYAPINIPAPTGTYINSQKTYDGTFGLVTVETDPRGKTTNYTYDANKLYPATITNALTQATQLTYDYSSGKVTQKTDPNGRVFQYAYDGLDRLLSEKQPDVTTPANLVVRDSYIYTDTPGGVSVHKTDNLDGSTARETYQFFDGLGRLIQSRVEGEGANYEVADKVYNNLGLLQKESLPYFSTGTGKTAATGTSALYSNYTYDPVQRVLTTTSVLGTTTNTYNDWKLTVTDANNKTKDLYKDAFGNLIQVDEHNSGNTYSTYYSYDYLGDLLKITDALGNIRNFTFDGLGRRLTAQDLHVPADATFGTWTYAYDDAGNLTQTIDPKTQTVNYTYDNLNRKLTEDYTGQSGTEVTNAYDAGTDGKGHLTGITTGSLTQTNTYNALGLTKTESKVIAGTTYLTTYDYDRLGNQINITNPDNSQVKNIYNSAGLLNQTQRKESTDGSFTNVVSNYDYSPTEQQTVVAYANGSTTTNTYDANKLYRLSSKVTTIGGSARAQDLTYTYDNVGNITRIIDASATHSAKTSDYAYDDLYRLISATISNVAAGQSPYTQTYSYDAIGNLLTKSDQGNYSYNGNQGSNFANPHAITSIIGSGSGSGGGGGTGTSTEILSAPLTLSGNNGSDEKSQTVAANILSGIQSVTITYNLHGLCALGGDASAIIFEQNGWKFASLSNYGTNCMNGSQTATIPIADFTGLNTAQPLTGSFKARFWFGSAFTVDITSVKINTSTGSGSGGGGTSTELLSPAWHLTGNNGSMELSQTVPVNVLNGKQSITVTYDLHGLCALPGDASAIVFDQNGWKYISLSNYGTNCMNGSQTVTIPLSDFTGLDTTANLTGTLHTRFWFGSAFTVDITSIKINTPGSGGGGGTGTSTEILTAPMTLTGNNGSDEKSQTVASNILTGIQSVTITYNLHGLCALGGDASAIVFEQNGWKYASLSNYGTNCMNGSQTATIPITDFTGLNTAQPLTGSFRARIWFGSAFTVDITSVKINSTAGSGGGGTGGSTVNYTYDNNGNMLTAGSALTNTWDYTNRITQSVAGAKTVTYAYDSAGQRIKYNNGTTTTYYPSSYYNTDGTTKTKHIFANGVEIATVTGTGASAVVHYTATDHLTGSSVVTNASDVQEELMDYYPFGGIRLDEKTGSYSDQRKYAGSEFDTDTALNYMNARYYNSSIGRFVSEDPAFWNGSHLATQLVDPQSWNSYSYARNNPLAYVDLNGEMAIRAPTANFLRRVSGFADKAVDNGPAHGLGIYDIVNFGTSLTNSVADFIDPETTNTEKVLAGANIILNVTPPGEETASVRNTASKIEWGAMWTETKYFSRVGNLGEHFTNHGSYLGFSAVGDYYQGAKNFLFEAIDNGYQATIRATDSVIRVWDSGTKRFASYEYKNGQLIPKTYMEASSQNYWTNQMITYPGQKTFNLNNLIK